MTKAELNAGGISNNAITKDLKKRLVRLAAKYETSAFFWQQKTVHSKNTVCNAAGRFIRRHFHLDKKQGF